MVGGAFMVVVVVVVVGWLALDLLVGRPRSFVPAECQTESHWPIGPWSYQRVGPSVPSLLILLMILIVLMIFPDGRALAQRIRSKIMIRSRKERISMRGIPAVDDEHLPDRKGG